ncbi:hypothetical protein HMPREF0663_10533 [Hoylesella oralis ATCC 33269]|uniref:Uncharacterized protein n=1 Tax=Hoylesella oralis ATCC 33269 TaxID=873533 RepID=E7RN33_9BACT|nr:hypothetical protein HMPREF0663_10533 [Hoylesella oralis ATCC 33269]
MATSILGNNPILIFFMALSYFWVLSVSASCRTGYKLRIFLFRSIGTGHLHAAADTYIHGQQTTFILYQL